MSSTFAVFADVLRLHRGLATVVLMIVALDAGLMFGISPFLVASYAAEIASGEGDRRTIENIAWAVSGVAIGHAILFYLRVLLRRRLTERGRTALSDMVAEAFRAASGESHRSSERLTAVTQKLQDAWNDLTFQGTELYLQFLFGTLCFFGVVAIQVPSLIVPLVGLIGLGATVAAMSGRRFAVAQRKLMEVKAHEQSILEAMNATIAMKWFIDKLSPERQRATHEVGTIFREQAQTNARWQTTLMSLGSLLQIAAIVGGSTLQRHGFSESNVILTVLLCFSMGERFVSMTNMVAIYQNMMATVAPMADFVQRVRRQQNSPALPEEAAMVCDFKDVSGVYTSSDGDRVTVQLPDVRIVPGVNILRGPSGTGKSTLVGILTGSVSYEGSVLIDGHELREWDASGRIVNGTQSIDSMRVPLSLLFEKSPHLIDRSTLETALYCAAYPDADLTKRLSEVSGGQLRRSMTASAAYEVMRSGIESGILVLDEPTNDLDPDCIAWLVEGLGLLAAILPHWMIVIPTHEPSLAKIAKQLIILRGGASVDIQTFDEGSVM